MDRTDFGKDNFMTPAVMFVHIVLALIVVCKFSSGTQVSCGEKAKNIAALDLVKEAITKAKDLYPNCKDGGDANETECGKRVKSLGYLDVALEILAAANKTYPLCPGKYHDYPMDCSEVQENGRNESGVNLIWPRERKEALIAYCDQETDGGGWTVIQRRGNFSKQEEFYRNWEDYKNGFGDIEQNFWIGNDNLFQLTNQASYAVRIDMYDVENRTKHALYRSFEISDEESGYKLSASNYSGLAGDCLTYLNDMKFSTKDRRNDKNGGKEACTESRQSGWWFNTCNIGVLIDCNPNGPYKPGIKDEYRSNYWWYWATSGEGLAFIEMKIKPTDKIDN
ncbi:hypothetical protein JTE90_001600 [Oedothorax gibbosus]|uniref:Fibrinogen C-terminal domain-containing protein n=1 Tax=Oedothorax gibbosus TaxID=931172 RepID=A0AAV6VNK8_9ARAC|nr:hypothetical protein JTE90_001600 [Oedothorax gibbosus]